MRQLKRTHLIWVDLPEAGMQFLWHQMRDGCADRWSLLPMACHNSSQKNTSHWALSCFWVEDFLQLQSASPWPLLARCQGCWNDRKREVCPLPTSCGKVWLNGFLGLEWCFLDGGWWKEPVEFQSYQILEDPRSISNELKFHDAVGYHQEIRIWVWVEQLRLSFHPR